MAGPSYFRGTGVCLFDPALPVQNLAALLVVVSLHNRGGCNDLQDHSGVHFNRLFRLPAFQQLRQWIQWRPQPNGSVYWIRLLASAPPACDSVRTKFLALPRSGPVYSAGGCWHGYWRQSVHLTLIEQRWPPYFVLFELKIPSKR